MFVIFITYTQVIYLQNLTTALVIQWQIKFGSIYSISSQYASININ